MDDLSSWLDRARRPALVALVPLFVLAVLGTAWLRLAPLDKPMLAAVILGESGLPVRHEGGAVYAFDLSGLSVASRGERIGQDAGPVILRPSHVVVLEDGKALRTGLWLGDVRQRPGAFLRQGRGLYLSSADGSDPRANGRKYTLVMQVPQWQLRAGNQPISNLPAFAEGRSLWPAAASAGLALALAIGLAGCAAAVAPGARRLVAVLCFAAVLGAMAIEAAPRWSDAGAMYDTASYMEPPRGSLRPPGYWLLAKASMADPTPASFASYPPYGVVVGGQGDGALRLVRTQKLIAAAALLVLGFGLASFLAAPIAAALTFGIGTMASGVPFLFNSPAYRWIGLAACAAALIVAAVAAIRGRPPDRFRPLVIAGAGIAAVAASGMMVEYGLFAAYLDWVQSESLALSLVLLTLAAGLTYLFAGWRAMLPAAALAAALAGLTHSASLYLWVIVLGLLPVAFARGRREFRRQSAAVLSVLMLGAGALYLFIAVLPATAQLNELHRMAFALRIAEPEDVDRMPDAASRAFLGRALAERAARRGGPGDARRAFREQLHELRFDIGWPAALAAAREQGAADPEAAARAIVVRASNAVLAHRFDRYLGVVWESLRETPGLMRISYLVPWWLLVPVLILLVALVRGPHGYLGAVLLVAAGFGCLLIAVASGPIFRLTNPIDLLLYLACVVLIAGAWQRIRRHEG